MRPYDFSISSELFRDFFRGYFLFPREERKNSSDLSFDSSEVSFDSSEEFFLSSEEIGISSGAIWKILREKSESSER